MKLKFIVIILISLFLNCEKESLKELDQIAHPTNKYIDVEVDFCTMMPDKIRANLKFIVVMDKSGSNQNLISENSGTDPEGKRRYNPLMTYLEEAEEDETVYYSLINFATEARRISGFTNDKEAYLNTIEQQANPTGAQPPDDPQPADGGWTNFVAALEEVYQLINEDINLAKTQPEVVSSYYVVVFISDGAPYVDQDRIQNKDSVLDQVSRVIAFEEENREYVDGVQLHTAYYYNREVDIEALDYMSDMAVEGNGDSYEFSAGQVIDFSKFSLPERNIRHLLRDVFVTNVNVLWEKERILMDSDGDGMVDELELKHNSNIYLRDTDGNGVSDGVEFFATGKPCEDKYCDTAGAKAYEQCNSYEAEVEPASSNVSDDDELPDADFNENDVWEQQKGSIRPMKDTDNDFLNDCEEKIVLKSEFDKFDSNEDWIPDNLAFRNKLAFIKGTSQDATLDSDMDGINNYDEVKNNTPMDYDNNDLRGLRRYEYKLVKVEKEIEEPDDDSEVMDVEEDLINDADIIEDSDIDIIEDSDEFDDSDIYEPEEVILQECYNLVVKNVLIKTEFDIIRVYLLENTSAMNHKRFMRVAHKRPAEGADKVYFTEEDFKN